MRHERYVFAMVVAMRVVLVLGVLLLPAAASAQLADPWPDDEPVAASAQLADPWPDEAAGAAVPDDAPPPTAKPPRAKRIAPPVSLQMRSRVPVLFPKPIAPLANVSLIPPSDPPAPIVPDQPPGPPARRYPFEVVDRPLVLPPGVTELAMSYQRHTFVDHSAQSFNQAMTTRVSRGTPDFSIAHAFSRAEVGLGIGQLGYAWVSLDTQGAPSRVTVSGAFSAPQADARYYARQSLSVTHKLWVEPGEAALLGGANVEVEEVRVFDERDVLVEDVVLGTSVNATLQAQVARRFALVFGGAVYVPLAQSALDVQPQLAAGGGLSIAFESWDLSASGSLANVTHDVVTALSIGIRKRFGL